MKGSVEKKWIKIFEGLNAGVKFQNWRCRVRGYCEFVRVSEWIVNKLSQEI